MSLGASAVSARPVVRAGLLELQRRLALAPENRGAVLEGRDIGTVVFPDADLKIFLTAGRGQRARRRFAELQAEGRPVHPASRCWRTSARRDKNDSERAVAPLKPAADARILDTSELDLGRAWSSSWRARWRPAWRRAGPAR